MSRRRPKRAHPVTSVVEGMTVVDLRRLSRLLRTPELAHVRPVPTVEIDGRPYWVLKPHVH